MWMFWGSTTYRRWARDVWDVVPRGLLGTCGTVAARHWLDIAHDDARTKSPFWQHLTTMKNSYEFASLLVPGCCRTAAATKKGQLAAARPPLGPVASWKKSTYLLHRCRSDYCVMFVFQHRMHKLYDHIWVIWVIWVHRSNMCHLRTICTSMSGVLGGPLDFHLRSCKELDHSECIMAAPIWTIGGTT